MNSRAASAATSRRVKQDLVRLLFGTARSESTCATSLQQNVACRAQQLDHSIYSYTDLRTAYLEKLQTLHPDKQYSEKHHNWQSYSDRHNLFVELQETWDRYDKIAKIAKNVDSEGVDKDRNFTMFGVGCSFSDNEWERELRSEITDQACRGWFSSGALSAVDSTTGTTSSTNHKIMPTKSSQQSTSLLDEDDDMFVVENNNDDKSQNDNDNDNSHPTSSWKNNNHRYAQQQQNPRPSLVDSRFFPRSARG